MMSKKPALLVSSWNGLYTLSNSCPPPRRSLSQNAESSGAGRRCKRRRYATVASDSSSAWKDGIPWREVSKTRRAPTPYEILDLKKGEPYSKRRFYELVKVYHPDRSCFSDSPRSRIIMVDRYRMIVAANSILSDPVKRNAYDKYGFGWNDRPEDSVGPHMRRGSANNTRNYWNSATGGFQWTSDPMYNATWEDWERWYQEQSTPRHSASPGWTSFFTQRTAPQHPLLANKHALISLIFLFAVLGGLSNATRARKWSKIRSKQAQLKHEETSKDLMQARQKTVDQDESDNTKQARISRFLSGREGYKHGEPDGRVLQEDDDALCAAGLTNSRDKSPFWERPPEK